MNNFLQCLKTILFLSQHKSLFVSNKKNACRFFATLLPISHETLAGIPWMSASRLSLIMQMCSSRGPRDLPTWNKFIHRADTIIYSLTAKDIAKILTSMAAVNYLNENFVRRLKGTVLQKKIVDADALSLAGISNSLSVLNLYDSCTFKNIAKRAFVIMDSFEAFPLALFFNAYIREKHYDEDLFRLILKQIQKISKTFNAQGLSLIFNAAVQVEKNMKNLSHSEEIKTAVKSLIDVFPFVSASMNMHSLALTFHAIDSFSDFIPKHFIDLLSEEILQKIVRSSAQQLAIIIYSAQKLQFQNFLFYDAILQQLRTKVHHCDAHGASLVAISLAKLQIIDEDIFNALYESLPIIIKSMDPYHLANFAYTWAKIDLRNDEMYKLLCGKIIEKIQMFSFHQIALTIYGYVHFKIFQQDLMEAMKKRAEDILKNDEIISEVDFAIIINNFSKINFFSTIFGKRLNEILLNNMEINKANDKQNIIYVLSRKDHLEKDASILKNEIYANDNCSNNKADEFNGVSINSAIRDVSSNNNNYYFDEKKEINSSNDYFNDNKVICLENNETEFVYNKEKTIENSIICLYISQQTKQLYNNFFVS